MTQREQATSLGNRQQVTTTSRPEQLQTINPLPMGSFVVKPNTNTLLGQIASGLPLASNIASKAIETYRNKRIKEIQAQEKAKAQKAVLEGIPMPKEHSKTFQDTYMKLLGYKEGAALRQELFNKYQTEFDKDTGDINSFIDKHVIEQLQGIDDVNYIDSFTTQALQARQQILGDYAKYHTEKTKENITTSLNTYVRDYISSGSLDKNAIKDIYSLGKNLNLDEDTINSFVVDNIANAIASGNIDLVDVVEKDLGKLRNNPKYAKIFDQAIANGQAEHNKQLNLSFIDYDSKLHYKASTGNLSLEDIKDAMKQWPEMYTNKELSRLRSMALKSLQKQRESSEVNNYQELLARGLGVYLPDGTKKNKAIESLMTSIAQQGKEQGLDDSTILNTQVEFLSSNGNATYKPWESLLNNGGTLLPSSVNGELPQGFLDAANLYEKLASTNRYLAERMLKDPKAKRNLNLYLSMKKQNMTDKDIAHKLSVINDKDPLLLGSDKDVLANKEKLQRIVDDISPSFFDFFEEDPKNKEEIKRLLKAFAMPYVDNYLDVETSLEIAKEKLKNEGVFQNGRYIYMGGNGIPSDFNDFKDYVISKRGIKDGDYILSPSPSTEGLWYILDAKTHLPPSDVKDPMVIFDKEYEAYRSSLGVKDPIKQHEEKMKEVKKSYIQQRENLYRWIPENNNL